MNSVFICGIPAVGKSFLAEKLSKELGILHINTDEWREELRNNEALKEWVDFFWNLNETEYWKKTTCDEQWKNIVNQSEAFWKVFKQKIEAIKEPAVFEGVNLLPRLMKETNLKGVCLISNSVSEIFERNKKAPRWGSTEDLQLKEAEAFVNCEALHYKKEAEKYEYEVFVSIQEAEETLKSFILQQDQPHDPTLLDR